MSTTAVGSDTDRIPEPRTSELATSRGETLILPGVVAKIARHAAGEVDGVEVAGASGLRSLLGRVLPGPKAPGSSADLASRRTALDLHVCVAWPRPVASVTAEVRRHVRRRVQELTGYEVTDVDIVVDALPAPRRSRARVS
jgi:uncharacterized alkaline shock family protein YloU